MVKFNKEELDLQEKAKLIQEEVTWNKRQVLKMHRQLGEKLDLIKKGVADFQCMLDSRFDELDQKMTMKMELGIIER